MLPKENSKLKTHQQKTQQIIRTFIGIPVSAGFGVFGFLLFFSILKSPTSSVITNQPSEFYPADPVVENKPRTVPSLPEATAWPTASAASFLDPFMTNVPATTQPISIYDLNNDGMVNRGDYALFIKGFVESNRRMDFNRDNSIDALDYNLLRRQISQKNN